MRQGWFLGALVLVAGVSQAQANEWDMDHYLTQATSSLVSDGFRTDVSFHIAVASVWLTTNYICGESHIRRIDVNDLVKLAARQSGIPENIFINKSTDMGARLVLELESSGARAVAFCDSAKGMMPR